MSNLGSYGGAKNPPWGRNNSQALVNQNPNLQQQIIGQGAFANMNHAPGMVQLQQHQVLQNAMNMQQQNINLGLQQLANNSVAVTAGLTQQMASNPIFQQVTYPNPRALNPSAFQTQVVSPGTQVQPSNNSGAKQRVFTGTVTKLLDNFGFIDDDVFFPTTACTKGSNPMVGDRVLVEATYNQTMPFKWNATRMQVLTASTPNSNIPRNSNNQKSIYNNMSPMADSNGGFVKGQQRSKNSIGGRGRERSRTRDEEEEVERKRRKEERVRDRDREEKKSPLRRRSRSPKSRRRSRVIVPRYMVQIPKINLDLKNADVLEVRRRYGNLYVPSDFFCSYFRWVDAFPPDNPLSINKPCSFHVMHKDVEPINENDTILEPPDADYLFSAKVMLMNVSGLDDMYHKCCALAEDLRRDVDGEEKDYVHPTRLLNFLVGTKGKSETMAIGGPWSKSLDGENPDKDPTVLIKTAIRTCKALTGIDLSPCTQWYRFVELYYRRAEAVHRGKSVPARVETVVLFLPDIWSCLPTRLEWDALTRGYQLQLENRIDAEGEDPSSSKSPSVGAVVASADQEKEEDVVNEEQIEPTPYTDLDVKTMNVSALRIQLKARNLNSKGLKSQLVARLQKALKAEAENCEGGKDDRMEVECENAEEKKSEVKVEEKKIDEKEKQLLEKRYALPNEPHIIVHPSRIAKSGKFDCTVMSLSLLLDYRPEDTKEHTFEVSLFAELFNEMLMRDFGFNIYKVLYELPEKPKEKEKEKDEKKKKKEEDKKKDEKDDKKEKDDRKKEDNKEKHRENKENDRDKKNEECKEEKKKESKKEDKRSEKDEDSEEDDDLEDKKNERDKKRKERLKMFTKDRHLLLSFTYFDQTHCGYIFEKDMEDLLFILGLSLSRAQVRKLVGKVVTRDSLHYRKLTDKPKEDDFIVIDDSEKEYDTHELAIGNKKYLPIFMGEDNSFKSYKIEDNNSNDKNNEEGLIMFRGAMVDVGKIMAQLERSEKARVATEACMVDLKSENHKLNEKNIKHNSTIKSLNSEVKEYKEKLKHTEDILSKVSTCSKMFQATLVEIKDKIDPVLKNASHIKEEIKRERDGDRDRKHEESKSRWERNPKDKDNKEKDEKSRDKGKDSREKEKEKEKEKESEITEELGKVKEEKDVTKDEENDKKKS